MEPAWIALQFVLLIAGSTLAQDHSSSFQQGFQPSSRQRSSQDNLQQPAKEHEPIRLGLLSQVPSAVRKQRPLQQTQSGFQQNPSTFQQDSRFQQSPSSFHQAPTTFQQPSPSFQQPSPPFQQPSPPFQQPSPPSHQARTNVQQPTFQPVRAPPPPPPQPQPQQNIFDQPQESFQRAPPPQQALEQPRETARQPFSSPSSVRKPFQQPFPPFQQPSPPFHQARTNVQQPTFQPVRAPPPPPPQPQPEQNIFDQPQESFQRATPPQQAPEQPRETNRQPFSSPSSVRKPSTQAEEEEELFRQQAQDAKYSFATGVTDGINDQQQLREEVRDGLDLKGMYSYSDGYFRRTIHYEADENGYRVTNEETEPIGNGPQEDPNGRADIELHITPGQPLMYSVTSADFTPKRQPAQQSQQQLQQQSQQQLQQQSQFNSARRPQTSPQQQTQQQQLPSQFNSARRPQTFPQQQTQQQQLPEESFEQQQF